MSRVNILIGGSVVGSIATTEGVVAACGAALTLALVMVVLSGFKDCSSRFGQIQPFFRRSVLLLQLSLVTVICLAGVWYGGLAWGWLWGASTLLATIVCLEATSCAVGYVASLLS